MNQTDDDDLLFWFLNHYECDECGETWHDEWDCQCDDRCPGCNVSCSPYESSELELITREEANRRTA